MRPAIHAVSSTDTYRRLAAELAGPGDVVLEVGCSTGEATRLLARSAARVIAVDSGASVVAAAREALADCANVVLLEQDGRDIAALLEATPRADLVFVDVGGNALLDNVALVLRLLMRAYAPRAFVVRSFEFATVSGLVQSSEMPRDPVLRARRSAAPSEHTLQNLLDLSRSFNSTNRLFATRMLRGRVEAEARARILELREDPHERVRFLASK